MTTLYIPIKKHALSSSRNRHLIQKTFLERGVNVVVFAEAKINEEKIIQQDDSIIDAVAKISEILMKHIHIKSQGR